MKVLNKKTSIFSAIITAAFLAATATQAVSEPKRTNPKPAAKRVNPQQAVPSAQQPGLVLGIPFSTTCGAGFTKAGQKKFGNGDMDWYVCSTPVLTCPTYTQENGLKATVTPKVVIQMIGGSPDGPGPKKFRVQYKCDYEPTHLPVG